MKMTMKMKMKIFHDDAALADMYLNRVQSHYDADEIIKGKYWEGGKGCAVGCTIHSSSHKDYETLIGLPKGVAKLQDRIFENLPDALAKEFPLKFIKACHKSKGKVSDDVTKKFFHWLLTEELAHIYEKQCASYKNAIEQCVRAVSDGGDEVFNNAASHAADAASDAAHAVSYAARVAAAAAADADDAAAARDADDAATYASYAAEAASFAALGGLYAARAVDAASYAARGGVHAARVGASASYAAHAVSYDARAAAADTADTARTDAWIRMSNKLLTLIEDLN